MSENQEKPRFRMDGHIHTLECGHAYNTITEMARAGKEQGMELICWTEHGPELEYSASPMFFSNMHVIPPEIEGVRVLKGIETNILNPDGDIDLYDRFASRMEVVSASLHYNTFKPQDLLTNTEAVLGAINNPAVDFLCHLGNPQYPIDYEKIVQEAKNHNKLIEVNNGSFFIRTGSRDNCINIAKLCKKYNVPIIVGTDAHFSDAVGKFPYAELALQIAGIPDELIINTEPERLITFLKEKGKPIGVRRSDAAIGLFDDLLNDNQGVDNA